MSINDELRKMSEIDRFRAKPDPGLNLSGKFFSTKFAQFNTEFGEPLIFAIGNAYVPKILRCLIESQQQQLSSC